MKKIIFLMLVYLSTASAQELSVVKGKLLGYDGKPMIQAHVHILDPENRMMYKSLNLVEVDGNGNFELKTDRTGLLWIMFTGVNHRLLETKLLIEEPQTIHLNVKLSAYDYLDSLDAVKIIGDFNNFDFATAKKMDKQSDGTFTAQFESENEKFSYQLTNITKTPRSINGTQADEYAYDDGGDYRSIIKTNEGIAKIVFDPAKLVRSENKPEIVFTDPNSVNAKLYLLTLEEQRRQEALSEAAQKHIASGKSFTEFEYDWSDEAENLKAQARNEKNAVLSNVQVLYAFSLQPPKSYNDTILIKQLISSMKPTSPLWSLVPWLINFLGTIALDGTAYDDYITQVIENHHDKSVQSITVFQEIAHASQMGDTNRLKYYYEKMMKDFGDTQYAALAKERFSPDKRITAGKKIPEFSIKSIDDSTLTFTNEYFKDKVLLIDFWAVWCKPCIGEMKYLHDVYEKYKSKNFEMLSISLDNKLEDVKKFRQGQWKMPWHNAFAEGNFNDEIVKKFEVVGIPKPILIDGTGKILYEGTALRGINLEKKIVEILK